MEPFKSAVAEIAALLAAQMHSVNSTFQSVVDYSTAVAREPCVHFPKTCRSYPRPSPPPTPPAPPPGPPAPPAPGTICNSSQWFEGQIPWKHAGLRPPFQVPEAAASAAECCAVCASPENVKLGCNFWTWSASGKKCYLKKSVIPDTPHSSPGYWAGSIRPWPPSTFV